MDKEAIEKQIAQMHSDVEVLRRLIGEYRGSRSLCNTLDNVLAQIKELSAQMK